MVGRRPVLCKKNLPDPPGRGGAMLEWSIDSIYGVHHDAAVRTTVTLDADTERLLRTAMRERNLGFKAALNDAIRRGCRRVPAETEPRFQVAAKPMHLRSGIDPSRMHDLDAALEVEAFKALTARLERERTQ